MAAFALDPSYVAGLFDGEGTIGVVVNRHAARSKIGHYALQVSLQLANADIVEVLAQQYGGSTYVVRARKSTHSDSFGWRLTNRSALPFLVEVGPLLLIKKRQATLAREFTEYKVAKGYRPLSDEDRKYYQQTWETMRRLNARGVGKDPVLETT